MNYDFDFAKLITWLLPTRKRKERRITWLYRLTVWLQNIHADFVGTADSLKAEALVTSQQINLEHYINSIFGPGIAIIIQEGLSEESFIGDNDDVGFWIGDDDEESVNYISDQDDGDVFNFIVEVPAALGLDLLELQAIINKYKTPGSTYKIELV